LDKPELMRTMRDAYQRLADVIEHLPEERLLEPAMDNESFGRLLAALEPVADEELIAVDRWQWLSGEALVETILWDSSRHYDAHREHLERLSR